MSETKDTTLFDLMSTLSDNNFTIEDWRDLGLRMINDKAKINAILEQGYEGMASSEVSDNE